MELPKVIFVPCPNSHQFQRREITVHEEVKVGRSVARCKTSPDNAIFDCKVLSRSHAVMWYQDGGIWIRDTNSSNGTFINHTRLSRGGEESEPFEINTGDIIQFGVDVMEAKKKDGANPVTHGCIIAKATVIIPNEILPNPECVLNNPLYNSRSSAASTETLNVVDEDQEILDLHAAIKNAVSREDLLQKRLQELECRLGTAIQAAEIGWQALIKEDKLLARIELLENQLEIFTRNPTEFQNKIIQLEEEKHDYQIHAKDSLKTICQEKSDINRKCGDLENGLTTARIEVGHYKNLHDTTQLELLKAQDQLRKKLTELENQEEEFNKAKEEAAAEHAKELEGVQSKMVQLEEWNVALAKEKEEREKVVTDLKDDHAKELEVLQNSLQEITKELETAGSTKEEYERIVNENVTVKDENYSLEEELMKLKEVLETVDTTPAEAAAPVNEKDSSVNTTLQTNVEMVDAESNTELPYREAFQRDMALEDQENQMNSVNIKDSMSQTEKWFDAISPSSSKSDILSSSFTAGDRRYRSLRGTRRDQPRNWSNSSAFEGSIAHAMALIESLDDIKSTCVKFRQETRDEYELSASGSIEESPVEEEGTDTKHELSKDISSPLRRRNSYREACEDETAATHTLKEQDDTFDDTSEADDQFVLAQEDPTGEAKQSDILNKGSVVIPHPPPRYHRKVEASTSSPKPDLLRPESPNSRGSMKSRFKGITSYMTSFWGTRQ